MATETAGRVDFTENPSLICHGERAIRLQPMARGAVVDTEHEAFGGEGRARWLAGHRSIMPGRGGVAWEVSTQRGSSSAESSQG